MSIIWTARNITLSELVSTWPQYFYAAFSKLVACKKINKKNKFNAREERNIWIKLIVSYRGKIIHDRTIHSNHYLCTCRQKLNFFYTNKEISSEAGHNWELVQLAVFWSDEPQINSTLRIASVRQNCHAIYQFRTLLLWFWMRKGIYCSNHPECIILSDKSREGHPLGNTSNSV